MPQPHVDILSRSCSARIVKMTNNTPNFQQVENTFQAVEQYYQQKFYEANQHRYRGQLSAVVDWYHQVKAHETEITTHERVALAMDLDRVQQQLQEVQKEYSQTVTLTAQLEVQCESFKKAIADQSVQTKVVISALQQILHHPRGTKSELLATLSQHGVSSPTAEALLDGGTLDDGTCVERSVQRDWSPEGKQQDRYRRKSARSKRAKIEDLSS